MGAFGPYDISWEASGLPLGTSWVLWGTLGSLWGSLGTLWVSLMGVLGILGNTGSALKGAEPPWGRADWATPVILRWFLGSLWVTLCGDLGGQPNMQTDSQPDSSTPQTERQTQTQTHRQTDGQNKCPMCFPFHCQTRFKGLWSPETVCFCVFSLQGRYGGP